MKKIILLLSFLLIGISGRGDDEALKDYSHVRGVCHIGWMSDEATIRKELGYARRIHLNSTRIWLPMDRYKAFCALSPPKFQIVDTQTCRPCRK